MKSKKGIKIIPVIFYMVLVGGLISAYVSLKLEIEKKSKEKTNLEEILFAKRNENTMLSVEVQKYKAEDRIVPVAQSRLNLVKYDSPNSVINVDAEELEQITKIINGRYE